mgnify:CR=1 FL=1
MLLTILIVFFLSFTDKAEETVPALSERAQALREQYQIPIDELDYPVSADYLDSLQRIGANVLYTSRWMNGASIRIAEQDTAQILPQLRACDFINNILLTRVQLPSGASPRKRRYTDTIADYGEAQAQLQHYNLPALHRLGFRGQGVHIAVIDGGFQHADTLSCFANRIIGAYDMTDDTDDFYGQTGRHGTLCLSTMAANMPGYVGAATEAKYVLIRSEEEATESLKETYNLIASLELADSLGVQICSVSLGYNIFDDTTTSFTHAMMDGRSTDVSRAATIAARKGLLICVAAGNEGNKDWHHITAPADADSILAVGAVGLDSTIADFSSRGYEGRAIKPEVCAVGYKAQFVDASLQIGTGSGTSFACPLIAGLAACLWSAYPQESAIQIRERIIRSAHQYDTPDYYYGYGIPDALKAYLQVSPLDIPTSEPQLTIPRKVLRDGRLFILRNGYTYDVLGR